MLLLNGSIDWLFKRGQFYELRSKLDAKDHFNRAALS
jgi:hypothetical protein